MSEVTEKLQKVMATAGLCSRRQAETLILEGRVLVNNRPAVLGQRVGLDDSIEVNGRPLRRAPALTERRVLMYNKPEGELCSTQDDAGRPLVFAKLPRIPGQRWVMVGRLDINTSGLLLFTNDGELANRLMHPSYEVEREYAVRVLGQVEDSMLANMQAGVELEDGKASFSQVMAAGGTGANQWYHVTLKEGRKREVRRLWESQGLVVSRLKRVRYGIQALGSLKAGQLRELTKVEVKELSDVVQLAMPASAAPVTAPKPRSAQGARRPARSPSPAGRPSR